MKILDDTARTTSLIAHETAERVAAAVAEAQQAAGRLGDAANDGASGLARRTPGIDAGGRSRRRRAMVPAFLFLGIVALAVIRKNRNDDDDANRVPNEMATGTTAADHGASVMRPDVTEMTEASDLLTTGTDAPAGGRLDTTPAPQGASG